MAQAVTLPAFVRELAGFNLSGIPVILSEVFRSFSQSFQTNSGIITYLKVGNDNFLLNFFTSLSTNHLIDALQYKLLTTWLSKS
jgi:hypothetical protein